MQRAGGTFTPGHGHSLSTHRGEEIQGGFVLDSFTGVCACVHMAGTAPGWCTPDLMWMVHDYAFNQLGLKKLLAMVRSNNATSMAQCLRSGYRVETLIRDMFGEGVHAFILYMKPEFCRWLNHVPKGWRVPIRTVVSSE